MLSLEYLAGLVRDYPAALNAAVREFSVRGHVVSSRERASIMGVINLSSDSWYRESVCLTAASAIRRGFVLQEQGADVIDIGAESTLAHAERAGEVLQNSKLLPVLEGLKELRVPISVETYNLGVAETCLKAGAGIINLTGSTGTEDFFKLARDHDAAVIICYVQGSNVREVADFDFGGDSVILMKSYFQRQVELAVNCGLEKIFIDPGLGFYYRNLQDSSVRVRHQMKVFLNTFRLRELGFPICHALPHAFEYFGEEVRSAEPFFGVLAALGQTSLFRTHEVPKVRSVLETMQLF